ncbi:MAG: ribosome maturation factor RimP [Ignavibacteriales bacterium]
MNQNFENIREIAEKIVEQNNLFLVDFIVRGVDSSRVIEIFIDGSINISADECALVSRELSKIIDEKELLKTYRLDVSSPGVDRPLIYLQQFPKHINRLFEIEFITSGSSSTFKGKLISIDSEVLTFQSDKEIKLRFPDIVKAKVLVSFN